VIECAERPIRMTLRQIAEFPLIGPTRFPQLGTT